jgi:MFS family permease
LGKSIDNEITGLVPRLEMFIGVFLLSLAILSFEIIVSRISSVIFAYNYAFIIVSLAILGLGCGGIFAFYKWKVHELNDYRKIYSKLSLYSSILALSISLFIIFITFIPIFANGFLYIVISFVPFFLAGIVLSLAFNIFAKESFKLYASNLLGSAIGAVSAIFILNSLGGINGVLLIGVLASISSFLFIKRYQEKGESLKSLIFSTVIASISILLFVMNVAFSFLGEVPIGRDHRKDLYNFLEDPLSEIEIIESRWSAFGRTDLIRDKTNGEDIRWLFIDGAAGTRMYRFDGNVTSIKNMDFIKKPNEESFPFLFLKDNEKENMLVIGPGGGKEVLLGLAAGVTNITGVEVNADFVNMVKDYKEYDGGIYTDFSNVKIIVDEGRSFLRGTREKFDIIMLSVPVTKSSRSIEGYALTENYLLTVQSIKEYFNHLTDEGRLIIVLHNSYEVLRFVSATLTAFEDIGINNEEAMEHIYTIGGEMRSSVVLKKNPITPDEANLMHSPMHFLGLDGPTSYLPYIKQKTMTHRLDDGTLSEHNMFNKILKALSQGEVKLNELVKLSPHDISAPTDDRPFFFQNDRGIPWNISALLILSLFINLSVVLIPLGKIRKSNSNNVIKPLSLFMLLGAGFMMIEIAFFQKLTLFMGSPAMSLATILGSILVGMGLGSLSARKFYPEDNEKKLVIFCFIIFAVAIGLFFTISLVLNNLLGANILIKTLISSALLIPLGFILGVPFPTGISLLKETGSENAIMWMYGVNGTMSVLGSVMAIALSILFGFSTSLIIGSLFYLAIALIFLFKLSSKRTRDI